MRRLAPFAALCLLPLTAAAARADAFDLYLNQTLAQLAAGLAPFRALAHVGDVRQRGFMVGIELVADRATREPYPLAARVGQRVCQAARARGAILRPLGDVIVLMPPLSIAPDELERLLAITYASIVAITEAR